MVGMLQIITYLLCVYLVYKGVEIFQLGYVAPDDRRRTAVTVGVVAVSLAILVSLVTVFWINAQANRVSGPRPSARASAADLDASSDTPSLADTPPSPFVYTPNTKRYHRETCALLSVAKEKQSIERWQVYTFPGIKPCEVCEPDKAGGGH